jgi:hypothetical protein
MSASRVILVNEVELKPSIGQSVKLGNLATKHVHWNCARAGETHVLVDRREQVIVKMACNLLHPGLRYRAHGSDFVLRTHSSQDSAKASNKRAGRVGVLGAIVMLLLSGGCRSNPSTSAFPPLWKLGWYAIEAPFINHAETQTNTVSGALPSPKNK